MHISFVKGHWPLAGCAVSLMKQQVVLVIWKALA